MGNEPRNLNIYQLVAVGDMNYIIVAYGVNYRVS